MTANQTIDGVLVSRELLESFAAYVADSPNAVMRSRATQLRSLLDAPACKQCKGSGKLEHHLCPCGIGWGKPAAQPQGEPVAWRVTGRGGLTVTPQYPKWAVGERGLTITPLYAEQPAPVAVASLEIVGRQCFPSETMKKIPNYRTEPWVDGDVHQSPSVPDLYRVEPLVRLSDVTRLNLSL